MVNFHRRRKPKHQRQVADPNLSNKALLDESAADELVAETINKNKKAPKNARSSI